MSARSPIATGVLLATLAAVAFGVAAPVVAWAGRGLGPLTTAALLYAGAALSAVGLGLVGRRTGARVGRRDLPRLALVALSGAAIAPTLFAWGLQRAGATAGSLLLNLEAIFTVGLARALYREPIGRRVALAVAIMTAAGVALTVEAMSSSARWGALGMAAVAGATATWALDNTLTRPLAERDPIDVVGAKAGLGVLLTAALALALREPCPAAWPVLTLLGCGATGYGLSLRLYLLAQRRIGAARTGSVFAVAPFIGAATAWLVGDRGAGLGTLAAALLFAVGLYLHISERHRHAHRHLAEDHDHPHRHDDGHHTHAHDPPVVGEHSHRHRHEPIEHDHDHAPDVHHDHRH